MAEELSKQRIDFSAPMQSHILACVLRVPGMLKRVRGELNPDYFDDDSVAEVLGWVLNFWDQHHEVPSRQAVKDSCREERYTKLIKSVYKQEVNDAEHTEKRICDFVHNRALRIAILKAGAVISAEAKGNKYKDPETGREVDLDPVKVVEEAAKVGRGIGELGDRWGDVLEDNLKEIICPAQRDTLGTGLEFLDNAGVVLERGELGCVVGAAKHGKSQVLVNIALNAMINGRNVLYYSLEMRSFRVFRRLYCRLAGKKQDVKADPVRFADAVRRRAGQMVTGDILMKFFPARTARVSDLAAHMDKASANFKPDLVIVDYAGILRPDREREEVRHNLDSIFLDLRAFAAEHDVFCWTAAQANRSSVNKEVVGMENIGEAFAIAQHIDVGFSISMTADERSSGKGRFYVMASRNEQDGCIVPFEHDYSRSYIRTLAITQPVAAKKPRHTSTEDERAAAALQDAGMRRKAGKAEDDKV